MEEKSIVYQNSRIVYRISGNGKPVMLLHGFGEDGSIFNEQVAFLQPHFRLIVPDIPGSGSSALVPDANIETYAGIAMLIIDKEIEEATIPQKKIDLVGHSMGGYIAMAFAEKYPEYLNSLGLFHSSAFADNAEKKEARTKAISFIEANGAEAFLKTSIPGLFTKSFAEKFPERIEGLLSSGKTFTSQALIQYYEAMIGRPDRTAVLAGFPKPVLFIIGEHDTAIPLQASLQQCHIPGESHIHILHRSAHMGMWEETDQVNTILYNFLQR